MTTSLSPSFIPASHEGGSALRRKGPASPPETLRLILQSSFEDALEYLRHRAARLIDRGETEQAVLRVQQMIELMREEGDESRSALDVQAMLLGVLTALHIESEHDEDALITGAEALSLLAREPRRKDAPFLTMLATLLYDLAQLHSRRGELKQAEREVEKSANIFEKLARTDATRYGSAHIMAIDAGTGIYRSRQKQAQMLEQCQEATASYLDQLDKEIDTAALRSATARLVESLVNQGHTLMQMGKSREAVGFYTRALKYHTRLEPDFDLYTLTLSIALGEALVTVPATRDKGVHLLNTMLHKATKLNADNEHRRIVDILVNVKTGRLGVLSVWHKIFPR